jgi:hypothetical protein
MGQAIFACIFFACLSSSILRVYISSKNYPGGMGMLEANYHLRNKKQVHIHIDVYTAMNGCSHFLELNPSWNYDKEENLLGSDYLKYTHLLSDNHVGGFEIIHEVKGYAGLSFEVPKTKSHLIDRFPYFRIKEETRIFLLQRKNL